LKVLQRLVPCSLVMLSGGFVTEERDPEDADLVVVVDPVALQDMDSADLWLLFHVFDARSSHCADGTLTITMQLAQVYPTDHPRYEGALAELAAARYLCMFPLHDDREAGYVQFLQCEGGEPTAAIGTFLDDTDRSA
jgi:hypothetical protein